MVIHEAVIVYKLIEEDETSRMLPIHLPEMDESFVQLYLEGKVWGYLPVTFKGRLALQLVYSPASTMISHTKQLQKAHLSIDVMNARLRNIRSECGTK